MRIPTLAHGLSPTFHIVILVSMAVLIGGCGDRGNTVVDSSKADIPLQTAEELQAEADAEHASSGLID